MPLAKAFERGYYDKMVLFIRNMLEHTLKTNDSLKFSVLTGCMRIFKESIFTGLNNLKVLSIAEVQFDEAFGFTDNEVREMLEYYGFSQHYEEVKEWYDGYQFGSVEVYCPWDVINYCDALQTDKNSQPRNYWSNTSSNEAVRRLIRESDKASVRREIERLIAGETITKEIHQELTYKDMYDSIDNLWSVLFTTQIMDFFKENVSKNGDALRTFCEALKNGNAGDVEKQLSEYLRRTISIRDTFVKKQMKENFYHGILLGILGFEDTWSVSSNREAGDGYSDILVETDDGETGILLELKYAEDGNLDAACEKALRQMEQKKYEEALLDEGVIHILKYGISFYKKRCCVKLVGVC